MSYAIDFTASLIKRHQTRLTESAKCEACKEEEKKRLTEEDEVDMVEKPEEVEAKPDDDLIEAGEGFEESIDDSVHFCPACNKHFLATPDTSPDEIACPICGEVEGLIDMGTAAEVQDTKLEVEEPVEEEVPEESAEEEADDMDFEEDSLEEGLKALAKRHISEKSTLRLRRCSMADGNLVLEGRLVPQRRNFKVVFEGFETASKESKKSFILEGTTDLFRGGRLKGLFVREGKKFTIAKCGYGLIKESAGRSIKVKGILG